MVDMPDDIERLIPGPRTPQTMASGDRMTLSSVVFFLDKVQEHLAIGDRDDRIVAIEIGSLRDNRHEHHYVRGSGKPRRSLLKEYDIPISHAPLILPA